MLKRMDTHDRRLALAAIAAAALVGTGAGALAADRGEQARPEGKPVKPRAVARSASGASAAHRRLHVLRRPRTAQDRLPLEASRTLETNPLGADVARARRAARVDGRELYVVPAGDDSVCLVNESGGGGCSRVADAEGGQLVGYHACVGEQHDTIVVDGMVGDAVDSVSIAYADGSKRTVGVTDNTYMAISRVDEPLPISVRWEGGAAQTGLAAGTDPC